MKGDRKMKKFLSVLLCALITVTIVFTFTACGEQAENTIKDPTDEVKLTINETAITLTVGNSDKLEAEPDKKIDGVKVEWFTSDENTVKVSLTGRVTAVAEGTAVITAYYGNAHVSCTVTVVKEGSETELPESITLSESKTFAVVGGEPVTLKTDWKGNVVWKSSDQNVLTVKDGVITAVRSGKATVTATAEGSNVSDSCEVYVADVEDKVTFTYKNGTEHMPSTDSTDPSHKVGDWCQNGAGRDGRKDYVTMNNGVITLNSDKQYSGDSQQVQLRFIFDKNGAVEHVGSTFYLVYNLTNETNSRIMHSSNLNSLPTPEYVGLDSGDSALVINEYTVTDKTFLLNIKLNNVGVGTLTVSDIYLISKDDIGVPEPDDEPVTEIPESIALSQNDAFAVVGGEPVTLTTDWNEGKIVWESSNEDVLTVNDGVITAVSRGIASVTATIEGSNVSDSCEVFVAAAEDKITATYGDGSEHVPSTSTTDPYEDGDWCQNKIGDNGRGDYVTMNNGVFTVTSDKQYAEESFVRYMFAHNGAVQNAGSSFYIVFTLTNDTDSDLSYCTTLNGAKNYTYSTLSAGDSVRVINKHDITESTYMLNIRLKNYGAGTLTFTDVYVVPESENALPDSLTLSESETFAVVGGEPVALTADWDGDLVWESSNDKVLTVSGGVITAVGKGEATVTATIKGSTLSDSCKVIVADDEDRVTYTHEDGETVMVSQSTADVTVAPGLWYINGSPCGDVTIKEGTIKIEASKVYGTLLQLRYIPTAAGSDDYYTGDFYMVYTITNDADSDLTYTANMNGTSQPASKTLKAGADIRVIGKFTSAGETSLLNIKLKNYGIGTITISDIYMIPIA